MELGDIKWFIGASLSVIGTLATILFKITARIKGVETSVSVNSKELHKRIEEVKDNYVRRDDFNIHMEHQEKTTDEIKGGIKAVNEKLDRLLLRKNN